MELVKPARDSRKGDNGRLLIVGGSEEYHGAPIFSLLAARRFVDLLYFYPAQNDAFLINAVKRIPEAIVVHGYRAPAIRGLDCVLYGVGMSKAMVPLPGPTTKTKPGTQNPGPETGNWKLVFDGDGLKRVKGRIPAGCLLTPHENEFRMLFGIEGSKKNVLAMAKAHRCVILKKGPTDIIADGRGAESGGPQNTRPGTRNPRLGTGNWGLETNSIHNAGMTKGGTGDVLAGLVAALACKNDLFTAAVMGAKINGLAGDMLFKRYGYNYCASDLAETLAEAAMKMRKG
ncbi:MAG: ADP/ATP-dependent (S)-NAD(P)H-hydrate dehydratase [Candidatus Micrarchaeota archaeon]